MQAQEWMAMQRPLTEAKKSEEFILIPNTVASSPEFLGLVQEMNNTYSKNYVNRHQRETCQRLIEFGNAS